jgi:hypothetical protein
MDFFKAEKDKEFESIRFKNLRKSLTTTHQVGRSNVKRDAARKALAPGKRISKTGKVYWETRRNRSDSTGKKI